MEETIKRIKKELVEDQYVDFWWGKDILILLDYIENESIPKEKVRELKNFYIEENTTHNLELIPISNVIKNINILLGE